MANLKRSDPSYADFKVRSRRDFPEIQYPSIRRDIEEVRRLMKRPPTPALDGNMTCYVCRSYDDDHLHMYCPCLDKIPDDDVVLGPYHDFICLGCGKIGDTCCKQGAFAVPKECVGCTATGHWYWESKCLQMDIKYWAVPLPSIDGVQPPPTAYENYEPETDDEFEYYSSADEEGGEFYKYLKEKVVMSDDDEDDIQPQKIEEDELITSGQVATGTESETSENVVMSDLLKMVGVPSEFASKKHWLRHVYTKFNNREVQRKIFDEAKKLGIY